MSAKTSFLVVVSETVPEIPFFRSSLFRTDLGGVENRVQEILFFRCRLGNRNIGIPFLRAST